MAYKDALLALTRCETDLRAEVAAAAQKGDYEAISLLTSWAQSVARLVAEASVSSEGEQPGSDPNPTPKKEIPAARPARATKVLYPRFEKSGDSLLKIGWSKKDKAEYEHKAPVPLAMQLASVAARIGARGKVFSMEDLSSAWAEAECAPSYQHYVVMAWWRVTGLVEQHGRRGYSVRKPSTFVEDITRCISELPTRSDTNR